MNAGFGCQSIDSGGWNSDAVNIAALVSTGDAGLGIEQLILGGFTAESV